jgi:uncharacterized membrane protein
MQLRHSLTVEWLGVRIGAQGSWDRLTERKLRSASVWSAGLGLATRSKMNNVGLQTYKSRNRKNDMLTTGLGWFSIALGAVELLLPGGLSRVVGVRKHRTMFRLLGVRELISGVGLLTRKNSTPWLWSRVAGDAMDLALVGTALTMPGAKQGRLVAAAAAVAGVTALDIMASKENSKRSGNGNMEGALGQDSRVKKSVIIDRSPQSLYEFWRNFENLPKVMSHLESVTIDSAHGKRSHWAAKGPGGSTVEWDAEMIEDIPSERISWRSVAGSDVEHNGEVRFEKAPGGRGTVVTVEMEYHPPGGGLGAVVAKMFRDPTQVVHDALRHFKQLMETGIVVTTKGQSAGRKMSTSKKFDYPVPTVTGTESVRRRELAHS